ncbi:DUF411 domain-containing protein [Methylopila sp. M107]|uniref:DUF411 domain-containing protein n=1 Tax=Methylopila sp. M107 TaxID=1101190 RepID=UPI00036FAF0D|nr:DUF411 domain-containing protein [Methylopila sp. M107]
MNIDRRALIATAISAAALVAARAEPATLIKVYKDPSCDCCDGWVAHLESAGYAVKVFQTGGMAELKAKVGVPNAMRSCHTAILSDYLLEGHVPAQAIARLLAERPVLRGGLAVPGMPIGSPGMEMPGRAPEVYDVILFGDGEPRPYMRFRGGDPV